MIAAILSIAAFTALVFWKADALDRKAQKTETILPTDELPGMDKAA